MNEQNISESGVSSSCFTCEIGISKACETKICEELMIKTFPNFIRSVIEISQQNTSTRAMKRIITGYMVFELL